MTIKIMTIKFIKDGYIDFNKGDIITTSNREADILINTGFAIVFNGKDKMMRPDKSNIKYRTK
jgi:hypothetical protein